MESPKGLRWLLLVVSVVYMQSGPLYHQVLEYPKNKRMMTWTMYRNTGTKFCDVDYIDPSHPDEPLNRFEVLLGHEQWWTKDAKQLRRLRHEDEVAYVGGQLCRKLGLKDLRVVGRCGASNVSWRYPFDEEANVCRARRRK